MFKPRYMAVAMLAASQTAHAQTLPNAGTQLQQLPQTPVVAKPSPDIVLQAPAQVATDADSGASIRVTALHITGQTVFAEAELQAASGFVPPREMNLLQLRMLATRIADHYHAAGYFLAQAYLPAQDLQDGGVTINVVEGRFGKVELRNHAQISSRVPAARLNGLDAGGLVTNAPIERRLLLLSDIPGVRVKGTLAPGSAVGTSDLIVDVTPGPRISGDIEADNGGARYTGSYRFGGTVNVNNPLGIGDQFSVRGLASVDGLAYGRVSYQLPVGNATVGVAYAHLGYTLGREFEALDGSGTADIFSLYGSYPLIRSRRANLYALADADFKLLRDNIASVGVASNKRIAAGTLGLGGDFMDTFGGNGSTSFSVGWTTGSLTIRSPVERAVDAITARAAGGFNKFQGSLSRAQSIAGPFSLYASVRGQYALDNLDSSEKIELGGAYGIRAYPEGEAFGDTGYLATLEAHLALGGDRARLPGRFDLIGFVETGEVRYAQHPWLAGSNHAVRSGYGAGVDWSGPQGLLIRTSYARKLGTGPAVSAPDRSGRFWFQVVKQF